MGKVIVDVDTEKKTMAIKVDGKSIANVREVYAYQGFNSKGEPDGFSMSVTAVDGGNEDIRKVTTYYASGSAEAKAAEVSGEKVDKETIPGFVGKADKTAVQKDIESFLGKNQ